MLGGSFLGQAVLGEGITTQGAFASGIPSTVAFGAPTLKCTAHLLVTGVASTKQIAFPLATTITDVKTLTATGLPSTVALGVPTVTSVTQAHLLPTGISSAATVRPASATTVVPDVVTDRALRLRPPGGRAPNGVGFRRNATGSSNATQIVSVGGIPPSGTYTNQAGVAYTTQAATPYTLQRFPTIGTPTVTRVLTALPTGIVSTNGFGSPNVRGPSRILCTGLASTVALGAPTFNRTQGLISPTGLPSTVVFGPPHFAGGSGSTGTYGSGTYGSGTYGGVVSRTTIQVVGIPSTVQIGAAVPLHDGTLPTSHWDVDEAEARWSAGFPHGRWHAWDPTDEEEGITYTHVVPPAPPPRQIVAFVGVAPTVAFGTPSFPAPTRTALIHAIASTGAFGLVGVRLGTAGTARPRAITSTVAIGTVRVGSGAFTGPSGLSSTVAFGSPGVARPAGRTVQPAGIGSTLIVGFSIARRPNRKFLSLLGLSSTGALGAPTVSRVPIGPPPPPLTLQQQIDATPVGGTLNIGSQQFVVPVTFGMIKSMRITGNPDAYIKLQTANPTDAAKRNMAVIDIRADNFTIDGFQIIGDGPSNSSFVITKEARHAIQVTGTNNTTIRNMSLHNPYGDGIAAIKHINGTTGAQEDCVNLIIEDCVLDQIGRVGITLDNVKGGHCTGSAPNKMVIRRHNNSAIDIEPPGGNDGCTDFVISNIDVYFNVGAGFTVSSAGTGGPEWVPGQPNPDPSTYTIRNIYLDQIRSHGAAFTITIVPPAFKAAYTDSKGVFHKAVYMVRRGPFYVSACSGDTPFNSASEPYRFHRCDGVTITNSNQTLGPNATAMVQFDNCTNATISPPASISP